jgi:hypothetical protein
MKKLIILALLFPTLLLASCGSSNSTSESLPKENNSESTAPEEKTITGALSFDIYAEKILTPEMVGVKKGLPVADATAVSLADGTVKIYFFGQEKGILSATSSGDFKTWTLNEPVTSSAWGQPRVLKLQDGSLRLYFVTGDGIKSAISKDGVKFEEEQGFRISKKDIGFEPGALSVVKLGDTYLGYFSELEKPGAPISKDGYYVAKSTDSLNWEFVGPVSGAKTTGDLKGNNKHPYAMINELGGVTLYGQGDRTQTASGITAIVSSDGLNFTKEYLALSIPAAIPGDPEIFTASDGNVYMIYGMFSNEIGGYLNLAKANSNVPVDSISSEFQQPGQNQQGNPGQPVDMANLPECKPGEPPNPDKPCRNTGK